MSYEFFSLLILAFQLPTDGHKLALTDTNTALTRTHTLALTQSLTQALTLTPAQTLTLAQMMIQTHIMFVGNAQLSTGVNSSFQKMPLHILTEQKKHDIHGSTPM